MGACLGRDSLPSLRGAASVSLNSDDQGASSSSTMANATAAAAAAAIARSQARSRHRRRRRASSNPSESSNGGRPEGISVNRNRSLKREKARWKSDIPLTEGQLKSKRDEFWDTAPAFDGKQEIWAALKAAVEATMTGDDYQLAQAILDGAGISLPHGSLAESYDELGTRYTIPIYCLSNPINILVDADRDSPAEFSEPVRDKRPLVQRVESASGSDLTSNKSSKEGHDVKLKLRVSLTDSKDVRLNVKSEDTVKIAKGKLYFSRKAEGVLEPNRQRWYFGGKLLSDKLKIGNLNIPQGYVIQCVMNPIDIPNLSSVLN